MNMLLQADIYGSFDPLSRTTHEKTLSLRPCCWATNHPGQAASWRVPSFYYRCACQCSPASVPPILFQALLASVLNGLWQEGFRFVGLGAYGLALKPRDWPWAGAAFGLGFAAAESVFILFQLESEAADSGLSLTPALLFADALPLTVERLALSAFSVSISVLLGIGFLRRRPAGNRNAQSPMKKASLSRRLW